MQKPISNKIKIRIIGLTSIVFLSLIAYLNQPTVLVYWKYANYQLEKAIGEDKSFIVDALANTLSTAKEAGYTCPNRQSIGRFAYLEMIRRRNNSSSSYHVYQMSECVTLPTGEIILNINSGNSRYNLLLKVDSSKPNGYRVLDITGQVLG
jgi:hypothetical protein